MTAWYTHVNGLPANQTKAIAAIVRAELDAIAASWALLPVPQAISGGYPNYAADTGTTNALAISVGNNVTAFADGMTFQVKALNNVTGATTIAVTGASLIGTVDVVRPDATVLQSGDWLAGQVGQISYNSTISKFMLAGARGQAGTINGVASGTVDLLTGSNIASAGTVNLDTATGNRVHVTGTTTITAVTLTRGPRTVIFDGALTLTHHATNNNLPGAANITTAAGDRAIYESDGTTVYCIAYIKKDGTAVVELPTGSTVLAVGTASNSTSIDFTSGIDGTYLEYECHLVNLIPASGATMLFRTSSNAGSTWASTLGDYVANALTMTTAGGAVGTFGSTSAAHITLSGGGAAISNSAQSGGLNGVVKIFNPAGTAGYKQVTFSVSLSSDATTGLTMVNGSGSRQTTSAVNGFRFILDSGNITSGTIILVGLRKTV